MSNDYVININTDYTDSNGNNILWSNEVLSVCYYDTTSSGIEEGWTKNWDYPSLLLNNLFTNEFTSPNWVYQTDDSAVPHTFEISRFAAWNDTDLARDMSVTSSGHTYPNTAASVVDFFSNYGWETSTSSGSGAFALRIDLGSVQDVNYFWFVPGFDTDTTKAVKDYRIGVSDIGTENSFTIMASGTTVSGSYAPVIDFLGNIETRYLKFYIDSNWGSSTKSRVWKMSAFYDPDWSMYGVHNTGLTGGTYSQLAQDLDLTEYDYLFFDVRAFMSNAAQVGEIILYVDDDALKTYNWSTTGSSWLDSTDEYHWTRREERIDVSSYTGTHTIKLYMFNEEYGRQYFMGYIDNIYSSPLWYREIHSSYRSARPSFPNEAYIISDRAGLSIVDKSDISLWMRFSVGPGNILESAVREVKAQAGKLYLATSRGLVILDFENNCAWRYDSTGLYYRMSLGRRNEYGFWFSLGAVITLSADDVYSVVPGMYDGKEFVCVGTGAGLDYIESPTEDTRASYSSNFVYAVRKLIPDVEDDGETSRVVYVGGFDKAARVGSVDLSVMSASDFNEQYVLYHTDNLLSDTLSGTLSSQWDLHDGNLAFSYYPDCISISGTKIDVGDTFFIQSEATANRAFTATVDVKINDWVDRMSGGLHFGLTSGWPTSPVLYADSGDALMLSAVNDVNGVYVQDDSLDRFPSSTQWTVSINNNDYMEVSTTDEVFRISGRFSGTYGVGYAPGTIAGSNKCIPDDYLYFTVKIKVRCIRMDADEAGRQSFILFGLTDGEYLGEGSSTVGVALCLYGEVAATNPPVYCAAYKSTNGTWYADKTYTHSLYSGDLTTVASWHTWEFTYTFATKTLNAAIDGNFVTTKTVGTIGTDVGIIFGGASNGDDITVEFKDFEIDFGSKPDYAKKEYVIQKYDSSATSVVRSTVSGTHLNGLPFYTEDGTVSAPWRTWKFYWDGSTTLSGSIDDVHVGTQTSSLIGDSPRVFLLYDMPTAVSGIELETILSFRNFNISYNDEDTVISGSPNNIWLESGTYLSVDYNTLYVATTEGINQLMYYSAPQLQGIPDESKTFGISGSSFGAELLYGTVSNCSTVEVEPGTVSNNGLLYTGTSRFSLRGWERLSDRTGPVGANKRTGITVSPDGDFLYLFYNDTDSRIYVRGVNQTGISWFNIALGSIPSGLGAVSQSRGYVWNMQDGILYCCAPTWFGFYDIANTAWLNSSVNIGTGPVYTAGGEKFENWEMAPILAKKQLFLMHHGYAGLMKTGMREWLPGQYIHEESLPWGAENTACVYSDVDDSIYILYTGSENNFYKLSLDTLVLSEPLDDCPYPYDFNKGISAFYRPYDECLYFILKGASTSYSRKIARYDVKAGEWSSFGIDVPYSSGDFFVGSYSYATDSLYVSLGESSARLYRYMFPKDTAPRFVSWSSSQNILPENSTISRYRKISFNSEYGNLSDSFDDSTVATQWFQHAEGTGSSITEGATAINFTCPYTSLAAKSHIIRAVPVPACDFSITAQVKINNMARSTGQPAGSRNMFLLGVTDYLGTPGYYADTDGVEIGMSFVGLNSLFMVANNDEADDVNKYSIYKSELKTSTYYNSSLYQPFFVTDATGGAGYHEWRIDYDHSVKQLDAYIDDVSIGSATLAGAGFMHGASLFIGAWRNSLAVSGTIDVDVTDVVVTPQGSTSLVSNYLEINDNDEYGYQYYEKYDTTITSGVGYVFESDWRIETYSVSSNEYITSVGSISDGNKEVTLAALYTGSNKVGLYMGGDPRDESSYTSTVCDWSVRTTYKIMSDMDRVTVYFNGSLIPSIDVPYISLPDTEYRCSRFGSFNPDNVKFINAMSRNGQSVTSSGTWTRYTDDEPSFYGGNLQSTSSSVDNKVICNFMDSGGGYLYFFHTAASDRATNTPITIYHSGVLTIPTPDSYITNPVNSVSDNIDEYGNADSNATTILLNQQRLADGSNYDRIGYGTGTPTGWIYLGRYTDINRVVVTCNGTSTNMVNVDSFKIKHTDTQPRSRSTSRVYRISYTVGEDTIYDDSDFEASLSIVDLSTNVQIDAYSDRTSPSIIDDNIYDFDAVS